MSEATIAPPREAAKSESKASACGGFIWYELMTPDPAASKVFYDAVVGWTIGEAHDEHGYRMIARADGGNAGGVLPLSAEMQQHGARPMWLGYLYVANVDATVAAVEGGGGKVLMPPWQIDNIGRIAMVTDPQGAPFYLMTPTPPANDPDATSDVFSVDQPQHVRWNELATSDPEGALAFYTGHFGWSQEGEMDMGPMGKYRFIQHQGVGIGAVMDKPPQLPVSLWTYYIGVEDIDRATAAVTTGGGQILQGPMEIPGGEFSLNGLDPQGAAFGLVGPRRS